MELPSLPTDKLYKVCALGGLAIWLAATTLGTRSVGRLQERVDGTTEELAALEVDAAFAYDTTETPPHDTAAWRAERRRQKQDVARRVAIIGERGEMFERDLRRMKRELSVLAVFSGLGVGLSFVGFAQWRRAERSKKR